MNNMIIRCDGGCIPNPGRMYGSYEIELNSKIIGHASRLDLGQGTNNVAEFGILIAALKLASAEVLMQDTDICVRLEILTDSKIVMNRLTGRMRNTPKKMAKLERQYGKKAVESAIRMDALSNECLQLMAMFDRWTVRWQPRERNVERFGH